MNRKQIQDQITLNMNDARTNTVTQILNSLDIVLRYMTYTLQIPGMIRDGFIRTTSGKMQYSLEPDVLQVQGKFYIPESNTWVDDDTSDNFNALVPSPDSTGIPFVSMVDEVFPIEQQPHTKFRLVSDSASDTQKVTIQGQSYGRYLSEAVTLTGTTAVLTTNEYSEAYKIIAASVAVGTITVTGNATKADSTLPTVATAGTNTIGTIVVAATESVNIINPGAFLRFAMFSNVAVDQSKKIHVEGFVIDSANNVDKLFCREDVTTDATDTSIVKFSAFRYTEVISITKEWDSNTTLYVRTDPGNLLVAQLGPEQRSVEYQQARFYNIPDGKTIKYRFTRHHIPLKSDRDTPPFPLVYHQVITEWTEKLTRGLHGDTKLGIRTLEGNREFDRAIRNIKVSARPLSNTTMVMGGDWRQGSRRNRSDRFLDFPIIHSTN